MAAVFFCTFRPGGSYSWVDVPHSPGGARGRGCQEDGSLFQSSTLARRVPMQEKKWVRIGLATLVLGGAFAAVSAAGCSSSSTPATPGPDASKDSSGSSSGGSGRIS